MITSSPGAIRARKAAAMASVPPQVTVTSRSGSTSMSYIRRYFSAIASRRTALPHVIAYWLMSPRMAAHAASFIGSGIAKSGKPCARLMAPCAWATLDISRMTDSLNVDARCDGRMRCLPFARAVGDLQINSPVPLRRARDPADRNPGRDHRPRQRAYPGRLRGPHCRVSPGPIYRDCHSVRGTRSAGQGAVARDAGRRDHPTDPADADGDQSRTRCARGVAGAPWAGGGGPAERLDAAFETMVRDDPFSGHVVIRSTDAETPGSAYRLWTTLKVPQGFAMQAHCEFLAGRVGAAGFRMMPAKCLFALGVGHVRRK